MVIRDPAFHAIVVIEISSYLNRVEASQYTIFTQKFHSSVSKTIKQFNGTIFRKDNNHYLIKFLSASDAVMCALEVQFKFKYVTPKHKAFNRRLNIAVSIDKSNLKNDTLSGEGLQLAIRMCENIEDQLVISAGVHTKFKSENQQAVIDKELIRILNPTEEIIFTQIMDYTESNWNKSNFNISSFSKELEYSKPQLYSRIKNLTGKSPNDFIREFRLHKALVLLHKQQGSISRIAYETGFSSPSYFSKCFFDHYAILPSKYLQRHSY
jgi:AraC-like DNA-binding protein